MSVMTSNTTGSGAIGASSTYTGLRAFALEEVRLHLSATGGAVENFIISLDAVAGAAYDVVFVTQDMNTTADVVYVPERPHEFISGDKLIFAYTNTNSRTWGLQLKISLR